MTMTIVRCAPTPGWHLSFSPAGVSVFSSFIHALIPLLKSPPRFFLSPSFCLFIKTTSPAGKGGFGGVVLEHLHHRRHGQYCQHTSLSDVGGASGIAPPLIFSLCGGTSPQIETRITRPPQHLNNRIKSQILQGIQSRKETCLNPT